MAGVYSNEIAKSIDGKLYSNANIQNKAMERFVVKPEM